MMQYAIARIVKLEFEAPRPAAELEAELRRLLLQLAAICSIKGIVPGHIKALLKEEKDYAAFSCTRAGTVHVQSSPRWSGAVLKQPELDLNVILVDPPLEDVEEQVDSRLRQAFPGYRLLTGEHEHHHAHHHEDEHHHEHHHDE